MRFYSNSLDISGSYTSSPSNEMAFLSCIQNAIATNELPLYLHYQNLTNGAGNPMVYVEVFYELLHNREL